jgi:hypothetical protein
MEQLRKRLLSVVWPDCLRRDSCLLQPNCAPSANRVLNLGDSVRGANQIVSFGCVAAWSMGSVDESEFEEPQL